MIETVIEARKKDLGGFEVGRVLPHAQRRMVGPFIFLDHIGPAEFSAGKGLDVRPHPHIGLSTVTYLYEGEIFHRDSLGAAQAIRPGEVNWMTAGKGIVHSERTDPHRRKIGSNLHGMQAWVALPKELEEIDPEFRHHRGPDLMEYSGQGLFARLIAGEAYGAKTKVRTHSPLYYVHWELGGGVKAAPPKGYSENAAYVVRGLIEVGGRPFGPGKRNAVESPLAPRLHEAHALPAAKRRRRAGRVQVRMRSLTSWHSSTALRSAQNASAILALTNSLSPTFQPSAAPSALSSAIRLRSSSRLSAQGD